jgi:hypothetical protein
MLPRREKIAGGHRPSHMTCTPQREALQPGRWVKAEGTRAGRQYDVVIRWRAVRAMKVQTGQLHAAGQDGCRHRRQVGDAGECQRKSPERRSCRRRSW